MLYDTKWDQQVKVVDELGQIMLKAADLLEKDGWCQHHLSNNEGAHCVRGALMEFGSAYVVLQAEQRLKAIGIPCDDWYGIVSWNNAPERTAEEVINALRAAACP